MSTEQTVMTKVEAALARVLSGLKPFYGIIDKTFQAFPTGQVVQVSELSLHYECFGEDGCGIIAAVELDFLANDDGIDFVWVYSPTNDTAFPIPPSFVIIQHGEKF